MRGGEQAAVADVELLERRLRHLRNLPVADALPVVIVIHRVQTDGIFLRHGDDVIIPDVLIIVHAVVVLADEIRQTDDERRRLEGVLVAALETSVHDIQSRPQLDVVGRLERRHAIGIRGGGKQRFDVLLLRLLEHLKHHVFPLVLRVIDAQIGRVDSEGACLGHFTDLPQLEYRVLDGLVVRGVELDGQRRLLRGVNGCDRIGVRDDGHCKGAQKHQDQTYRNALFDFLHFFRLCFSVNFFPS